ncbi:beta-ketoacyl reductase, partial [Streptomyces sp. NPDC002519]
AAANSVLDALALLRRSQGLPAVSLAWGMWETGMGGRMSDKDVARLRREGFPPLGVGEALALMDAALLVNEPVAVPVALRTAGWAGRRGRLPSMLRDLAPADERRRVAGGVVADGGDGLAKRLRGLGAAERDRAVLEVVQSQVAGVLGRGAAGSVDPAKAFKELGFDSLTAVDLRNRLNSVTGLNLPATLIFDHPTVLALRDHLSAALAPDADDNADHLLGELDKLRTVLAGTAPAADETTRTEIAHRLQQLVTTWSAGAADDTRTPDRDDRAEIDNASDDELFALLDDKPWAAN